MGHRTQPGLGGARPETPRGAGTACNGGSAAFVEVPRPSPISGASLAATQDAARPKELKALCTQDKQLCCKYKSKNPMASRRIFLLATR